MSPEQGLTMPVEIFFNPFKVYHVEWLDSTLKEKHGMKKKTVLHVRPKEEGTLFREAFVQIHPRTFLVKEIQLFDFEGNRIHYEFSKVKVNKKVKSSAFQFNPPKDVEVVER
jgi:outer membrane lipoprotein-sorting protein